MIHKRTYEATKLLVSSVPQDHHDKQITVENIVISPSVVILSSRRCFLRTHRTDRNLKNNRSQCIESKSSFAMQNVRKFPNTSITVNEKIFKRMIKVLNEIL